MNIDVLCNDGSPIGVTLADVYGGNGRVGVGGAELALLTMCEAWHNIGHRVRLYNSPRGTGSPFRQYSVDMFNPHEERDILIIFRSPNPRITHAKGKKIWWSCDQYTVGNFTEFHGKVDKIVTISPFHANYFKNNYGIQDTTVIDLPVRTQDYQEPVEKIKHRMIYCSIPDRGLSLLAQAYPRIKQTVPDASLSITSDYRLWGVLEPRNEKHIQRFLGMEGVRFLSAIPRLDMVREQMLAEVQAYPCTYDELFCYSVAECQTAAAYPVTTPTGALATTNMASLVTEGIGTPHFNRIFSDLVIETLLDPHLRDKQQTLREMAMQRFSLERITNEWEKLFNE